MARLFMIDIMQMYNWAVLDQVGRPVIDAVVF